VVGVLAAWAYSAEPVRLKRSGWWGPGLVGCPMRAALVHRRRRLAAGAPPVRDGGDGAALWLGAHGIMTINDFKAIEGDRQMGVRSLPVVHGPGGCGDHRLHGDGAGATGGDPLLVIWGAPCMRWRSSGWLACNLGDAPLAARPGGLAPWFNGTGVGPYVLGMMVAAFALRGLEA
jgi:chlorophyll/bacteriochlorophyll a synthase